MEIIFAVETTLYNTFNLHDRDYDNDDDIKIILPDRNSIFSCNSNV